MSKPAPSPDLPAWWPSWARQLAELYFSGTTCLFILHGNVHDLIYSDDNGRARYLTLSEFLATQVFGSWDIVLHYDLARGLRALAGSDSRRLQAMVQALTSRLGKPGGWPRDADAVLLLLDRLIEQTLLEEDPARRKSLGILFDYAQYLVPAGDPASLAHSQGANLVRFLGWAQNPYIKRLNIAFCLIADKLSEINSRLVQSMYAGTIEVPLPGCVERQRFCESAAPPSLSAGFTPVQLADLSNGLSLADLNVLLAQARQSAQGIDADRFRQLKKTLIERQCQGLLEFIEPRHTLDLVVGHDAARERLREDAELLMRGRREAAPMGYLICGPVGTGKSFLAECYAGSIGVPCVKLRNFRSKYVGETEGNLEQVLTILRSLGPVVVVIDEADAALGTRQAEGDSGTSSRVFAMLAAQMGDTRYRGQIIWMLLTSRPDRLPIDVKRQGRAEVHIPLFYPQDETEIQTLFHSMARKNRVALAVDPIPPFAHDGTLSGSDIESILLAAQRKAIHQNRTAVEPRDLAESIQEFMPSMQTAEKALQELSAVLECTHTQFLPSRWRAQVQEAGGRTRLQQRWQALQSQWERRPADP